MVLDHSENFVGSETDADIASGDTTISVVDASVYPDPASVGDYQLTIDNDAEIVRLTAVDTGTDTLTVTRGQENTSAQAHTSPVPVDMNDTAKMFEDIDAELAETISDSGTDTDGGNDYQLPQAADNLDLQGDGAIRNADSVDSQSASIGKGSADTAIDVSAPPYNAPKLGNGDATTAIQNAIDDLPSDGGTLVFPYLCLVTSTLDATETKDIKWQSTKRGQKQSSSTAREAGGGIWAETGGSPVIDAAGAWNHEFSIAIMCPDEANSTTYSANAKPNVGVLMARGGSNPIPYGHLFNNAHVDGDFTQAAVYNVGKEDLTFWDSEIAVYTSYAIEFNGDNSAGVTSPNIAIDDADADPTTMTGAKVAGQTRLLKRNTQNTADGDTGLIRARRGADRNEMPTYMEFEDTYFFISDGDVPVFELDDANGELKCFWSFERCAGEGSSTGPILQEGPNTNDVYGISMTNNRWATYGSSSPKVMDFGSSTVWFLNIQSDTEDADTGATEAFDFNTLKDSTVLSNGPIYLDVSFNLDDSFIMVHDNAATVETNNVRGSRVLRYSGSTDNHQFTLDHGPGVIPRLAPRSSAPENPEAGMTAVQDGTNWNPAGTGNEEALMYLNGGWTQLS